MRFALSLSQFLTKNDFFFKKTFVVTPSKRENTKKAFVFSSPKRENAKKTFVVTLPK